MPSLRLRSDARSSQIRFTEVAVSCASSRVATSDFGRKEGRVARGGLHRGEFCPNTTASQRLWLGLLERRSLAPCRCAAVRSDRCTAARDELRAASRPQPNHEQIRDYHDELEWDEGERLRRACDYGCVHRMARSSGAAGGVPYQAKGPSLREGAAVRAMPQRKEALLPLRRPPLPSLAAFQSAEGRHGAAACASGSIEH
mmetsp:Transcript_23370/g.58022  ORF Transcript_23370/g.58022 Transcript_23370/m.58022 type:complete len:200 (+) Transcript_23370:148-747(+)